MNIRSTLSLITIALAALVQAQTFESNGVRYAVTAPGEVAVVERPIDGVNAYEGTIILPEQVFFDGDNYRVTAIDVEAFAHSAVTHVAIPNTVAWLGEAAFAGAGDLVGVTLPLGLKEVPPYCFAGTGLESIAIPDGVEALGDGAFESCDLLHTVFLPSSLRYIDHGTFDFCHTLAEIYCAAPEPPLAVEDDTFAGLKGIDLVVFDDEVAERYNDDAVWGNRNHFTLYSGAPFATSLLPSAEEYRQDWQQVEMRKPLDEFLAFRIYNEADELVAVTAASSFYLPATDHDAAFTIVPTTFLDDADPITFVVPTTTGLYGPAEETIEDRMVWETARVWARDGVIHVSGNHYGEWVNVFDLNGTLRYHRQSYNDDIPGLHGVYIVVVGRYATKVRV